MSPFRYRALRPSWIAFGWFIAAAVTSLLLFGLAAFGIMEAGFTDELPWIAACMAIGFAVGGYFAGQRSGAAPVLHGIGIGAFSLVVWILANLLALLVLPGESWDGLGFLPTAFLLVLQGGFAVLGAWIGVGGAAPAGD